ncbi:C4-dicarboxylate ABC transporter permease, partial [Halomonas litopenaei]|nr:C4-dicarboxylate ABC transporter permease [Halomonas litopenaei]
FAAAFIPGILAALGYMLTIAIYVRLYPDQAGTRPRVAYADRIKALGAVWPVLLVFGLVVGGIYQGWFTPTEGAAVGAMGTGLIALFSGTLNWQVFRQSITETATGTGMIFFIVLGAAFYNGFLALTQVPQELSAWVTDQGFSPWMVMVLILVFYLILGCLMDSLSMILLTVPIFWPVISAMDFGMTTEELAVWFGILVLIVVEVGLITPPVGLNLFIINGMANDTPIKETYKGALPFVITDLIRVVILTAFPAITLWLVWFIDSF